MSAIALPCIHTVNSDIAVSSLVNAEHIMAVETADIPARTENGVPSFVINFTILATDNQLKSVVWTYSVSATAEADRDADYALVVAAVSTAI